jgi:hypothetical protein
MNDNVQPEGFEPEVLVEHIDSFGKGLSEWEINFIADMMDNPPERYVRNAGMMLI